METALLFRQKNDTSSSTVFEEQQKEKEKEKEGLFCRECGHYITSKDQIIEVDGQHYHTFFNPAGVVYEIGCFSSASGCQRYGPPSSEFTWFAGYTWQMSLCAVCQCHLGWFFRSIDASFYGLIVKNLTTT